MQCLAAREGRLGGKQTFIRRTPVACLLPPIRRQTEILGPAHSTTREPRRSSKGPISGAEIAANTPPNDTAPESAVRDQPNSRVNGSTKIDKVATAGPCRANPAQHKHVSTTQP